ncbi:MAG TPA: family 16 glycoside hydrolase [Ignavibacteria bacterium]
MHAIKITNIFLTVTLGFITTLTGSGQGNAVKYDLFNMTENNKLEVFNRIISSFADTDKKGIRFSKKENDGIAWLNGVEFSNGSIELDIRGKDAYQQSFVGIAFHGSDNKTLDVIYFRPFNFQSSDPVRKIHAVQYVSHPDNTWDILRNKYSGKYEKAVIPSPNGNEWFHVKILIKYPEVTVFVNGNSEPSLTIEKLNTRKTGKIGLWVGNNSDGDFANLQITPQN